MSIHTTIDTPGIYFITFTCYDWIPLIEITNRYDLVYKWFDVLTRKGHTITGYVIMPNHIHILLYYSGGKQTLNTIIGNGKRFMAYGFIKRLKNLGNHQLINRLNSAVEFKDRSKGQLHEIWEDSFDVKHCRSENFILQKLNYMHWNPCVERWKLVKHPYDYLHSSSSFYELGKKQYANLKDYRDFLCLIN